MLHRIYADSDLTDQQLKQMLDIFIERMLEKMKLAPEEAEKVRNQKETIIDSLVTGMKGTEKDSEVTLQHLNNPQFLKKLFAGIVSAISLTKNMDLKPERLNALKPELENKGDSNAPDSEDLQKLKDEFMECKKDIDKVLKESHEEVEEKPQTKEEDPNVSLLGLVTSYLTGGFAATLTFMVGNLFGYPDQNPQHGYAAIDKPNNIEDTAFADPLGLNADAVENYMKQESFDESLVVDMQKEMGNNTPKYTPQSGNHQ